MYKKMSRQILKYLNTPNILQKATYKHFVVSESLANIERECARYCYVPRIPPRKVTVVGAGSDVGCISSLFLKQQKVIKTLALYDDDPEHCVVGMAMDLAHIDTSTEVQAFRGRAFLKTALHDTDVVLICGGRCACCESDRELFFRNMRQVRTVTVACAQFCPHAVIAIQTPPVDCNFALCVHTLKLAGVYDKRKVLGINAINSMRANQLFSAMTGSDPSKNHIPVVCGTGKCTRVPVFSIAKAGNIPQAQVECLTRLVREADDIVCRVNSCHQQAHLSLGFSTARFVTSIMTGLHERPTFIDSALVEQEDPSRCYGLSVCASPVTVGSSGVVGYAVPKLSEVESQILEDSKCDLEDMLNLGRCYASGDEYCLHPDKVCPSPLCFPCPTCEPCQSERKRLQTFP